MLPVACPLVGTSAAATQGAVDRCWGDIANALAEGPQDLTSVEAHLRSLAPSVADQIERDRANAPLKSLWGKSINFDELAKATIVVPGILDAINDLALVPARDDRITHAGFEHTYGYLLSVLKTPFGFKRARWVTEDIETGFGLARGTLSPAASSGTLLSNLTYFAGNIAFGTHARARDVLDLAGANADAALKSYEFHAVRAKTRRLEESLALEGGRTVVLRTDFVPFVNALRPAVTADGGAIAPNAQLLVYSIDDSSLELPRLVTAFAVTDSFVATALNPANLGDGKTIITRYNGFVSDVTGHDGLGDHPAARTGTRRVITSSASNDALPEVCNVNAAHVANRAYCDAQYEDWAIQCCPLGQVANGGCTIEVQRCRVR